MTPIEGPTVDLLDPSFWWDDPQVRAGMPVRVRYEDHADHTVATFAPAVSVEDIPGFL